MLALFVGQHTALVAKRDRLLPHEHFLANKDKNNKVCRPERAVNIETQLTVQLWHHARMHQEKTQVWNLRQRESHHHRTGSRDLGHPKGTC